MLTGLLPASSGGMEVYGKDVSDDLAAIRKDLGVCPQHDVVRRGDMESRLCPDLWRVREPRCRVLFPHLTAAVAPANGEGTPSALRHHQAHSRGSRCNRD